MSGHFQLLEGNRVSDCSRECDDGKIMKHLLQDAASVDKYVGLLVNQFLVAILDLDVPFAFDLVPCGVFDGMTVFDVLVTAVLVSNIVHVRVNLLRCGVIVGPFRVRCKAEGVVVCWDIALALWIWLVSGT
jgi:hypothetical protein